MPVSLSQMLQGPPSPIETFPPISNFPNDARINAGQRHHNDDNWGDSGPHSYSRNGKTRNANGWRYLIYSGGLGKFFFSTELGWQIWIVILALWLCGSEIALVIANRTILWSAYLENNYTSYTRLLYLLSGTSEFSYPITTMYVQLVLVHFWILLSAHATRWMSSLLQSAGLGEMIAPRKRMYSTSEGLRGNAAEKGLWKRLFCTSGGIAGGGLFEFDYTTAKHFQTLVAFFVAKNLLSTISFTHAQYPVYILARIGIVPLVLFFTYRLGDNHNWMDLLFTLAATCALGISIYHPYIHYSSGSIIAGVFASIFAALYTIQIHRTWTLVDEPRISELLNKTRPLKPETHTNEEATARSFWTMLHYISLLSVILSTPVVIFSGELPSFLRNFQTLDGVFYWSMVICGSFASWAVFVTTISLTVQTSPISVAFLFIPEASVLQAMMIGKRLPARSWIALSLCWAGCLLYLLRRWQWRKRVVRFYEEIDRKHGLPS